ncbi:MAG: substrate-binding domain-containing protein [Kiritimatiellae bacterium]|nr:substrate-binding domain-containing protein [Kiritimatiellia bacterium]
MRRRPFDPGLPRQVAARFFDEERQAGEPFWTVREIASQFDVSYHAAHLAVAALLRQGVVKRHARRGTCVATGKLPPLTEYQSILNPHLAIVFPWWTREPEHNSFALELRTELFRQAQDQHWRFTFHQESGSWDDPLFPARLLAAGCTSLIALGVAEEAVLAVTRLHDANVPIVTIGRNQRSFKFLNVPVVDGDDHKAMWRLAGALLRQGCRRIVVAGNHPRTSTRLAGFREAFIQARKSTPMDAFIDALDYDYVASSVWQRLDRKWPPQAVICQDFYMFRHLMALRPELTARIKAGLVVAVFDHFFLNRAYPDLPLVEVTMDPSELARTAMLVLRRSMRGESVPAETLVDYRIQWPSQ